MGESCALVHVTTGCAYGILNLQNVNTDVIFLETWWVCLFLVCAWPCTLGFSSFLFFSVQVTHVCWVPGSSSVVQTSEDKMIRYTNIYSWFFDCSVATTLGWTQISVSLLLLLHLIVQILIASQQYNTLKQLTLVNISFGKIIKTLYTNSIYKNIFIFTTFSHFEHNTKQLLNYLWWSFYMWPTRL